jgi:hypothetical protein
MGIPLDMVDVEIKSYHFGVPAFFLLPGACALLNRATFPLSGEGFSFSKAVFVKSHDRIMRLFDTEKNGVLPGVTTCASRM